MSLRVESEMSLLSILFPNYFLIRWRRGILLGVTVPSVGAKRKTGWRLG